MKMTRWSVARVLTAITVFCCIFSVQADDKQLDQELFEKVISKLDKGGSYLNFQSNKYLFQAIENAYSNIPAVIQAIVPDQQQQAMPMMIYHCLKPINSTLGIHEILGIGASSVLIADKTDMTPALFRSRQFIYWGEKKPQGLIWDFSAEENRELVLTSLPKETLFAYDSYFSPGKIWSKIKDIISKIPIIQETPIFAEQAFSAKFGMNLPEVLENLDGVWSSLVISAKTDDGKNALFVMLSLPNKNDLSFKFLAEIAKSVPELKVSADEINSTTPTPLSWVKPLVRKDDKNVYIVSNPEILEIVKNTAAKKDGLISTPEFKFLSQGLPEKGIAFVYLNGRTLETILEIIKANTPGCSVDLSVFAKLLPPSDLFVVISKENDGIMHVANSPMDIPQFKFMPAAIVQVGTLLPSLNKSRENARRISCMSILKSIGLSMKMYAMDHDDKFPAGNNAAGFNELIKDEYLADPSFFVCPASKTVKCTGKELNEANSSYIYLGGFAEGDSADIPLAFDKLDNHPEMINILYLDGHVAAIKNTFSTCEALIAFLAESNNYKPEILEKLQAKA
ncbi:MAG: DUF3352 domain-containing protein, partial [Lentisphaerae bacterium]|nr:DUF3352 domain-containing protein [Lentisphaerota bacterium]